MPGAPSDATWIDARGEPNARDYKLWPIVQIQSGSREHYLRALGRLPNVPQHTVPINAPAIRSERCPALVERNRLIYAARVVRDERLFRPRGWRHGRLPAAKACDHGAQALQTSHRHAHRNEAS